MAGQHTRIGGGRAGRAPGPAFARPATPEASNENAIIALPAAHRISLESKSRRSKCRAKRHGLRRADVSDPSSIAADSLLRSRYAA